MYCPRSNHASNSAGDDREGYAENLGNDPGFHLTQLRPALEKYLGDAHHPPPHYIRCLQLAHCVADDGTESIKHAD